MVLQMKSFSITFPAQSGSAARITRTVSFNTTVRQAEAVLKGFDVSYVNADRELERLLVDIDLVRIAGNDVEVAVDFLLKDSPNPIDQFQGSVEGVIIADVV